jgi:putative ABC transport system permease protein
MYLDILKRDIKRKRIANIIVLLFVILSSMFVSSSVSNFRTITISLDQFMEQANMGDYFIVTKNDLENSQKIEEFLEENEEVDSWRKEVDLGYGNSNVYKENNEKVEMDNLYLFVTPREGEQAYFNEKDEIITEVNSGKIYILPKFSKEFKVYKGDVLFIKDENMDAGEKNKEYKVEGIMKDAMYDSTMMGGGKFLISEKDYEEARDVKNYIKYYIYVVNTENPIAFERDINDENFETMGTISLELVKITYIVDMVIAGILLIVSICLILISLLILRFILAFTISEEFREIGIMKAIGIKNRKIRSIYGIKYFLIAVVGTVIGYFLGIPFGKMLLKSVSENCLIVPDRIAIVFGLVSSVLIGAIVVLFSFTSTKGIKKLSPMDAIRNGQDGERYHKKGLLKLRKTKMSVVSFMAVNDVVSYLKRYVTLFVIFIIGTILIIVPAITADTLQSDGMIELCEVYKSDLYLSNMDSLSAAFANDEMYSYNREEIKNIELKMAEIGYSGVAYTNERYFLKIQKGELSDLNNGQLGLNISASLYPCIEGRSPMFENEVSLGKPTADVIDADIGDVVIIYIGKENIPMEFIVSGFYQSLNNMGKGIRFHEDFNMQDTQIVGGSSFQYTFDEKLTKKEIEERIKIIKEEFSDYVVNNNSEFIEEMLGYIADQVDSVKFLILFIMTCIDILVTVLMVKSFILKDKTEIALLKAIGFSNRKIMMWQVKRIGFILLISTVIGIFLSNPIAQISVGKIFASMGATSIDFVFDPIKSFLLYPGIVICSTLLASIITALQVRHINASEINSIE